MSCFGFLKIMMFFFNGVIFLAGAGILGVGVWVKVDSNSLLGLLGKIQNAPAGVNQIINVGYLMIAVGGVLVILGFLGCCGAIRESKCMLLTFFVIVLIVFIAEVAAAVVILIFKPLAKNLINILGDSAVSGIKSEYGKSSDLTLLWNTTMAGLKCCGFYNYSDFMDSQFVKDNKFYPSSCCSAPPCYLRNVTAVNVTGCFDKMVSSVEANSAVIVAVALGIAVLEVSAMAVSMTLYCKIEPK